MNVDLGERNLDVLILEYLFDILVDIKLNGHGYNVKLNENAYVTLRNIAVTIDEPIIVDLN